MQSGEDRLCLTDRERRHLVNGTPGNAHIPRFATKTAACAIGTGQVPTIAAQKHPNVDLVLLALEPAEEAANAVEIVRTLDHKSLLVVAQISPGNVEGNLRLLRCALEHGELRPVVRL